MQVIGVHNTKHIPRVLKNEDIIIFLLLFYGLYDFCLNTNSAIVVPNVSLSHDLYAYRSLGVTLHKKIKLK